MGIFRRKRLPRSEQTMQELEKLGPIVLNLDNHKFTFDNGQWTGDPGLPMTEGGLHGEVKNLRREKRKLRKEVDKYARQAQEMSTLKEKLNLLDFKYQLLLEMWTTRSLDNEQGFGNKDSTSTSPRRISRQ